MATRPDKYPEWASQDVQDPIALSDNVIEPPPEKKLIGWSRLEKPPRNWMNWLDRKTYQWIAYFDSMLTGANGGLPLGSFTPTINGLGGGSFFYALQKGYYQRIGNTCFINIEVNWQNNSNPDANVYIPNLPFAAKNDIDMNQTLTVCRGVGPTLAGKGILKGLLNPNSNFLVIWADDPTTGNGTIVNGAGNQGQLIITGTYLIQG